MGCLCPARFRVPDPQVRGGAGLRLVGETWAGEGAEKPRRQMLSEQFYPLGQRGQEPWEDAALLFDEALQPQWSPQPGRCHPPLSRKWEEKGGNQQGVLVDGQPSPTGPPQRMPEACCGWLSC